MGQEHRLLVCHSGSLRNEEIDPDWGTYGDIVIALILIGMNVFRWMERKIQILKLEESDPICKRL